MSNKSAGESGNVYTDSGDESSESVISSSNDGSAVSGRKSSRLNVIKNEKTTGSSSPRETSSGLVTNTSLFLLLAFYFHGSSGVLLQTHTNFWFALVASLVSAGHI